MKQECYTLQSERLTKMKTVLIFTIYINKVEKILKQAKQYLRTGC